jgi:hypothetical protein
MNLIEIILSEAQNDDEDTSDQSDRLNQLYDSADEKGKQLIDDALICICGWSMSSLIERL